MTTDADPVDRVEADFEAAINSRVYRLIPEPKVLAQCETFEDYQERWRESRTILSELASITQDWVAAVRERRRRRLELHRLQVQARDGGEGGKGKIWLTQEQEEAREKLDDAREAYNEQYEHAEALKQKREGLQSYIERHFVALQVDGEWPDLRMPDEKEIADQVGYPVGGWDLMPVPTSG